ncbi:universal stress protein [Natribaculum luteum]|uniref:Universal stress protein n=1 Tax=Natribaculum luteum TaxID=1586232 RepID=A0ABD5P4A9_9EURY|nr:universal stress protein [Natribaculum luteum]
MYETILVATDGSDVATTAAEQGLAMAADLDATIHVLSVADVRDDDAWSSVRERWRADCREYVDDVSADAAERDVPVETEIREGKPTLEILDYADDVDADLLVMGTHGRTGLQRLLLGSVAISVIRDASRPVLTVGPTVRDGPRRFDDVVVATDGRPGVGAAVDAGIALAEAYGATVHALSVVDDTHSHIDVVREEFERIADQSTREVAVRAADRGVGTVRATEYGRPSDEIISYARDHDADVVVMGTESRTELERFVLGSASQRVVSGASVPVLTVRATPN